MKTIKKDELFSSLGGFLKAKGIELNEGSYTTRIQQGCNLLSDAINATQKTVEQTKVQVDQALDQLRQTIHQHTAPPPPAEPQKKKQAKASGKRPATATSTRRAKTKPKT
jgi:TPP-dependent 2-oxoacid decarboxylase